MAREGPRQCRAVRPPCATHPLRAHPSRTVAPIPVPESPVLVRKAHYPTILPHSQQFGAALPAKDIIDKWRCSRRLEHNRRGPHEDEA